MTIPGITPNNYIPSSKQDLLIEIQSLKPLNPVYSLQGFKSHKKVSQNNSAQIDSEERRYQSKLPWVLLCIPHHQPQINSQA